MKGKQHYLTIRNCNYRKLKATGNTCNGKLHTKSTVDNYSDLSQSFLPQENQPRLCSLYAFSLTMLLKAISDHFPLNVGSDTDLVWVIAKPLD